MRRFILGAALLLAGCGTLGNFGVKPSDIPIKAEQSLTVSHIAYNTIGKEILLAVQSGVLKGDNAVAVKKYFDQAGNALEAADLADKASNDTDMTAAVADADAAIAQVKKILGGN